jgi:hypothetical protein
VLHVTNDNHHTSTVLYKTLLKFKSPTTLNSLLDAALFSACSDLVPLETQQRVRQKAAEYGRRVPTLRGVQVQAKDAACVLIALQEQHLSCDRDMLARTAGCTRAQLLDAFRAVCKLLAIDMPPLTMADLAVTFGCNPLKQPASTFAMIVKQLIMQGRPATDALTAVCFWMVCRAVKQQVQKGKLCEKVY